MSRSYLKLLLAFSLISNSQLTFTQWFDPQTLQATVLLEKIENNRYIPHGTGILFYNYDDPKDYIVVTCAHLIKGKDVISVRVNPDSTLLHIIAGIGNKSVVINNAIISKHSIRFIAALGEKDKFINSELDIAAFKLKVSKLKSTNDSVIYDLSKLRGVPKSALDYRNDLQLGDELYFIGFPLGYGVSEIVEPIVRSGSISWLPSNQDIFLIDAFSYGGNSGSPIFRKMIIAAKPGNLEWTPLKLMGMIVGHQSIKIDNMLTLPNPNELRFDTTDMDINIGLARCVYV